MKYRIVKVVLISAICFATVGLNTSAAKCVGRRVVSDNGSYRTTMNRMVHELVVEDAAGNRETIYEDPQSVPLITFGRFVLNGPTQAELAAQGEYIVMK